MLALGCAPKAKTGGGGGGVDEEVVSALLAPKEKCDGTEDSCTTMPVLLASWPEGAAEAGGHRDGDGEDDADGARLSPNRNPTGAGAVLASREDCKVEAGLKENPPATSVDVEGAEVVSKENVGVDMGVALVPAGFPNEKVDEDGASEDGKAGASDDGVGASLVPNEKPPVKVLPAPKAFLTLVVVGASLALGLSLADGSSSPPSLLRLFPLSDVPATEAGVAAKPLKVPNAPAPEFFSLLVVLGAPNVKGGDAGAADPVMPSGFESDGCACAAKVKAGFEVSGFAAPNPKPEKVGDEVGEG